jgi:glycosyltransferase involved in cell wall biosynthesis
LNVEENESTTPIAKVRVGWVASPQTLANFSRMLQPLAVGLMDEMVDVTCFCPVGADTKALPSPPIDLVPYGRLKVWFFHTGAMEAMVEEIRSRKLNLLHALDAPAAELTCQLARQAGVRFVASSYCVGDSKPLHGSGAPSEAIIAASEPVRRDLIENRLAVGEKIHLVRPGIYQVKGATCFLNPEHSVTIVAGGSLDYYDAFAAVLQTFATLRDRGDDCVFFVIGSGRHEGRLRQLAETLKLCEQVTFTPRQPSSQLAGIFKAADIYISPARSECIDVESLLAMASGVPVLATTDRASDFLIDGRTAMMFEEGNSVELTVKLTSLLDDRPAAVELAEHALGYARDHHSPTRMIQAVVGIYREAIVGRHD